MSGDETREVEEEEGPALLELWKEYDCSAFQNQHLETGRKMVEHAFSLERVDPQKALSIMERGCIELMQALMTSKEGVERETVRKIVDTYISRTEGHKARLQGKLALPSEDRAPRLSFEEKQTGTEWVETIGDSPEDKRKKSKRTKSRAKSPDHSPLRKHSLSEGHLHKIKSLNLGHPQQPLLGVVKQKGKRDSDNEEWVSVEVEEGGESADQVEVEEDAHNPVVNIVPPAKAKRDTLSLSTPKPERNTPEEMYHSEIVQNRINRISRSAPVKTEERNPEIEVEVEVEVDAVPEIEVETEIEVENAIEVEVNFEPQFARTSGTLDGGTKVDNDNEKNQARYHRSETNPGRCNKKNNTTTNRMNILELYRSGGDVVGGKETG